MEVRDTTIIIYCHKDRKDAPLASVRYTKYDSLNRVIDVDQVDYEDKNYFHSEVLQAIACGIDVLIYTHLDGMSYKEKLKSGHNFIIVVH